MLFKSIIKRFFSIQFGRSLNEDDLYLVFKDCLEKIHQDDIMILNNPSFFYDYIDCGIRSQKSWYSSLYILIYLQIIALTVFSIIKFSVIHLVIFVCMILLQYMFCWIAISIDRQYQFIDRVMNWSLDFIYDLDLVNYLMVDSGFSVRNSKPFEQDKYAKIWLKEMSTSMDMDWESIVIELLPGKNVFVPKIRVSLGGNKKTIQDASVYGFTDKNDDQIKLSSYLKSENNKITILNFWATWCPPCIDELPSLNNLSIDIMPDNIDVLAISMDRGNPSKLIKFLEENGGKNLVFFQDKNWSAGKNIPIQGLPVTLIVKNKDDILKIIYKHLGPLE